MCVTAVQLHQAAASPASDAAPARARRVLQLPRQEGIGRLTVLVAMYSCMRYDSVLIVALLTENVMLRIF